MGMKVFLADKETQTKIYDIVKDDQVYGFIEHYAEKNPAKRIEYIGANKDYTPITQNLSTSEVNYGSWESFPVVVGNKPYMVSLTGSPSYRLKEDDYTKKIDGTESDVKNASSVAGAYAWLPRVYTRQEMYGDNRYVYFSFVKKEGFEAIGFREWNGNNYDEFEGVWLPMFYGSLAEQGRLYRFGIKDDNGEKWLRSIANSNPINENTSLKSIVAGLNLLRDKQAARGYRLFEGAIISVISDLLIMFAKTTDIMSVFGHGAKNKEGAYTNEVIGGGQFKGTADGKSLNKIFHSIVLGSYLQWQVDTRMYNVKSRLTLLSDDVKVQNYPVNFDDKCQRITNLADDILIYKDWRGVSKHHISIQGTIPAEFSEQNDVQTKSAIRVSSDASVALRLGTNRGGGMAGLRTLDLYTLAMNGDMSSTLPSNVGASSMIVPPVGFIP